MDIRFLGHAAFALEHDGKIVLPRATQDAIKAKPRFQYLNENDRSVRYAATISPP